MLTSNRNIREILYDNVDEVVLMKEDELSTHVNLLKQEVNTVILHLAKGQLRLQDFGMVI
jgi:hypothetical protein